jgi:hypothetical protein
MKIRVRQTQRGPENKVLVVTCPVGQCLGRQVERRAQLLTTQNVVKGNGGFECLSARRIRFCEFSSKRARVYVSAKQASRLDSDADASAWCACLRSDRRPIKFGENVYHRAYDILQASKLKFEPCWDDPKLKTIKLTFFITKVHMWN